MEALLERISENSGLIGPQELATELDVPTRAVVGWAREQELARVDGVYVFVESEVSALADELALVDDDDDEVEEGEEREPESQGPDDGLGEAADDDEEGDE